MAAAAPIEEAPTDTVSDGTFSLRAKPAGPYKSGELGRFVVELKPHGEYHINQEYPMGIEVDAVEAVVVPKAKLARADATRFDEHVASFDIPFTPQRSGPHTLLAKVAFAVCTDQNCIPDERTLALSITVE